MSEEMTAPENVRFMLRSIQILLECGETVHAAQLTAAYLEALEDPETSAAEGAAGKEKGSHGETGTGFLFGTGTDSDAGQH